MLIPAICMLTSVLVFQACKENLTELDKNSTWLAQESCPIALSVGIDVVATGETNEICVIGNQASQSLCCTYKVNLQGESEWVTLGNLNEKRSGHDAVAANVLVNGKVQTKIFVFGGYYQDTETKETKPISSVERLNFKALQPRWEVVAHTPIHDDNLFSEVAAALYYPQQNLAQAVIFVIEGKKVQQFSAITERWETCTLPDVPEKLFQNQAITYQDKLYYFGATTRNGGVVKMYVCDLHTKQWSRGEVVNYFGEQLVSLTSVCAITLRQQPMLLLSGSSSNDFFVHYNLTTHTFGTEKKIYGTNSLTNTNEMYAVNPFSEKSSANFLLLGGVENVSANYVYKEVK